MPTVTTIHYGTPEHAALIDSLTPEPAPLPDPWPNMLACWTDSAGYTHRRKIVSSFTSPAGATRFMAEGLGVSFLWSPEVVREVRSANGEALWRRP